MFQSRLDVFTFYVLCMCVLYQLIFFSPCSYLSFSPGLVLNCRPSCLMAYTYIQRLGK